MHLVYKVVVCMLGKGADERETATPAHEEYSTENTTRKEKLQKDRKNMGWRKRGIKEKQRN